MGLTPPRRFGLSRGLLEPIRSYEPSAIRVFPLVGADHCARILNLKFQKVATDGRMLAEALRFGYETYHYDMVLVFSDPYVEAEALGCPVEFNPYAFVRGPSKDPSRSDEGRTPIIIEAAGLLKELDAPVFVSMKGPFSLASLLAGVEVFLKMLIAAEDEAEYLLSRAVDFQHAYLERLLPLGVDIFIGDPVASSSVISPECFRRFVLSPLRSLVQRVKETGRNCGIHICGDTEPIITDLDQIGADILSIEDIRLKTRTLRMGGVRTGTILSGDRAMIREEAVKAKKYQPLILSTSCDVPPEADPESINTLIRIGHGEG